MRNRRGGWWAPREGGGPGKPARLFHSKKEPPSALAGLAQLIECVALRTGWSQVRFRSKGTCPGGGLDPQWETCRRQPTHDSLSSRTFKKKERTALRVRGVEREKGVNIRESRRWVKGGTEPVFPGSGTIRNTVPAAIPGTGSPAHRARPAAPSARPADDSGARSGGVTGRTTPQPPPREVVPGRAGS